MPYGIVEQTVDANQLTELVSKLTGWSRLTTQQAEGNPLHHFVRGLIFSAELVDMVEDLVCNGYHAGWGQLVDREGGLLSPENDLIVYHGKPMKKWRTGSFTYSLIRSEDAVLVIQCRAIVRSVGEDLREYATKAKGFCPHIWLFAECCWAKSTARSAQIARDARAAGYEKFFYLYDHSRNEDVTHNFAGWHDFKQAIARSIRPVTRRRRSRSRRK